jgi:hypothetical protein
MMHTVHQRDMSKYRKVVGIDSSSTGIAWTYLLNGIMIDQGKIKLTKIKEMNDKMAYAAVELGKLFDAIQPDHVFVEKSIFVKNPATARTLSYIVGMIITVAALSGFEVTDVEPSRWKSYFGYKNLSAAFVADCKTKMGRIEGDKFCVRLRKSQTWRVIMHNYPAQAVGSLAECDNDISDSWGIGLYGYDIVGRKLELETGPEILFDTEEFDKWNLSPPGVGVK